jgi:hypothetical protein
MGDEHIKEAGWVAQSVAGASSYFYAVGYDKETFKQELAATVEHINKSP